MRFAALIFSILICVYAHGEEISSEAPTAPPDPPKHLLEMGLGFGAGHSPDYPGAGQSRFHFLPFPIFYFHGKIFRSDREDGARARVVNQPRFGIDVSGGGGFAIDSDDNTARRGMPDLEWLGEAGPRAYVRLYDKNKILWRAYVAGRGALSTDFKKFTPRGFVIAPGMGFEHKHVWRREFTHYAKITSEFATKDYNTYFYSVDRLYATAERPEYNAVAGYLGTYLTNGLSYETHDFLIATGLSLMFHGGSANRDSPLFKNEFNFGVFVGFAGLFYHSEAPGHL